MPCHGHRHHRHPFHHRYHPYFPPAHPFFFARGVSDDEEQHADDSPLLDNKARVQESEDSFLVYMDVPGVKVQHVTVEEQNGEIEITAICLNDKSEVAQTYQDVLYLKPTLTNVAQATATLVNGVLTITVPKIPKEGSTIVLETETAVRPPVTEQDVCITVDLPGVQLRDLLVEIHPTEDGENHMLLVKAKRPIGDGNNVTLRRIFEIPKTADQNLARSYLMDGGFTWMAPRHQEDDTMENNTDSAAAGGLRTIVVTTTSEEEAGLIAGLSLQDEGMVEAVAEDKDWEAVSEETKPAAVDK